MTETEKSFISQSRNNASKSIAIIGAGNCGQALAGILASQGHQIRLYNRSLGHLNDLVNKPVINCFGAVTARGEIACVTDNIRYAIKSAEIIFVTTTADAHRGIASLMANHIENDQVILLCPGRTGGALEFREVLKKSNLCNRVYIAEAQSFMYACRANKPGSVHIIGEKKYVLIAAYPTIDTLPVFNKLKHLFPSFIAAENVLQTSFLNVGAIFHPGVMLFNAAAIERGSKFFFYQDMTPSIAEFILQMDQERLSLGEAYGINILSIMDWIYKAYPDSSGDSLCEHMRSNPAYYAIYAPVGLNSRYLLEDIPTGIVPLLSFGEIAGLEMPLFRSIVNISSALLRRDFFREGRTLDKLGLAGKTPDQINRLILEE